jgi:hypothetical protein
MKLLHCLIEKRSRPGFVEESTSVVYAQACGAMANKESMIGREL